MGVLSGQSRPKSKATKSPFVNLETGPWTGVWDSTDSVPDEKTLLADALNVVFDNSVTGGAVFGRTQFTASFNTTYGSGNRVQGGGSFWDANRQYENRIVIANGNLYLSTTSSPSSTPVTLSGGCAISSTAKHVYLSSLGGKLVINDLTNQPFWYDLVAGTMGLIQIDVANTAWHASAKQTTYGGSVFFIDQTGRAVWCEANDVTIGYIQTPPYTNVWTLEQTGGGPLTALVGTNRGLYYFRAGSIGLAFGAVGSSTFSTTATHAAISDSIGCSASGSAIAVGESVFFADAFGHPWMITPAGELVPIWKAMQVTFAADFLSSQSGGDQRASGEYIAAFNADPLIVAFGLQHPTYLYMFDVQTGKYWGRWQVQGSTPNTLYSANNFNAGSTGPTLSVGMRSGQPYFLRAASVQSNWPPESDWSITTRRLGQSHAGVLSVDLVQAAALNNVGDHGSYDGVFTSTIQSASSQTATPSGTEKGVLSWGANVAGRYFVAKLTQPVSTSMATQQGIYAITARAKYAGTTTHGIA